MNPLRPEHFARQDERDDAQFYDFPRQVTHIDDAAIASLAGYYLRTVPPDSDVLDLMSSWVSHLPDELPLASVVGLGMNAEELAANPRLTARLVHDLNRNPKLPFPDASFDAVLIAVSVQYLTQPVEVFAEVARVLRPDAPCIVSYSNRCFPTKAVAAWRAFDDHQHAGLIALYFRSAGGFAEAEFADLSPAPGQSDPLYVVQARRA
jgi:SAM-dependent methyltransferase